MTYSSTTTSTFTRTHAKYLASKAAADLRQMQRFYGRPSDSEISDYIVEMVTLLAGGYLHSVEYGFKKGRNWVVALRYVVRTDGSIATDDRPGRVTVGADVSRANWYSYLRYSRKWLNLSEDEQQNIESELPVSRTPAPEPQTGNGYWTDDKRYSKAAVTLSRGRL